MIDKYIKEAIDKVCSSEERQSFIEECISNAINDYILSEANKIRKWGDADYRKVNPLQLDVPDEAYKNVEHGEDSPFMQMSKKHSDEKDKYQDELTKNLRKRLGTDSVSFKDLMDANGNSSKYMNTFSSDYLKNVKDRIEKHSNEEIPKGQLDLSIRGKMFSYGNGKLPANTMIFNLTSALNCPSKLCKFFDVCYAKRDDKLRIDSMLRNFRNQVAVNNLTLKEFLKLIEMYIEYAPMRIKRIRISESGDFTSQKQVDIAKKLASHLKAKYDIDTVVYTAMPLDFSGGELIVNASNNKVIGATRYFFAKDLDEIEALGIDTAEDGKIKEDSNGNPYFMCPCDCRKCGFCYRTKESNGEGSTPTTVYEKVRGVGGKLIKNLKKSRKNKAINEK